MSNIIDKIQVSGVTYDIGGGGGVPESAFTAYTASTDIRISQDEEVTAAGLNDLNESLSGKVNTSDNIVSGASIQYAFDKEDTKSKFLYSNGERITEFYVKFIRNYNLTGANTWSNLYITTDGSSSSGTSMTVDASNYAITNIVSTSGDITTTLENGVVKVVLPEGYYLSILQQNANFQISYDKFVIASGQTADVINDFLNDSIQDIYDEIPKRYVTSISTGLMSKQMNIYAAENAGSSQSIFFLGDSLKGDNNKLDVYFAGETMSYTPEILNTGTTSYTKVPASPTSKYGNGFGEIDLAVNTGFTGSAQSVPVTVVFIDNYSYTYNYAFTYDIVNKTINGGQSISNSYSDIYLGSNKIYIYPKINYKYRVVNIECASGFICGVDRPVKDSFVFTGVTGNGYVKQGQEVIDELFRAKASYNEMYTAINQATSGKVNTTAITSAVTSASTDSQIPSAKATYDAVSGKQDTLVSGTNIKTINNESILGSGNIDIQGGSVTVDTELDSGSTNPVQNKVIYNKIDEVEQVTAAGLNALNDNFGGLKLVKLSQAQYDALTNKDASTLYIILD